MLNIAIVGFGLCGRIAAQLLSRRHKVCVFEAQGPDVPDSAGVLAAAMLAPLAESVICEKELAEEGVHAISLWPGLLDELDEPVFFQRQGTLILAHEADRGAMQAFTQRLKPLAGFAPQQLNHEGVSQLEPGLAGRFGDGLYLPGEGQLDNLAFYRANYDLLRRRGVEFRFGDAVSLAPYQVSGRRFDLVIDCRGMGAKPDAPTLRGVRGEVVRLHAPEVMLNRPVRLMHPRYPIYIAPKPGQEFVVGATEIESQDTGPASVRSTLELLSAAYSVHSGFAEARVLSVRAGLRPAFYDNRPKIEKQPGLIRINGLYRHGFLLAPSVVSRALAELTNE